MFKHKSRTFFWFLWAIVAVLPWFLFGLIALGRSWAFPSILPSDMSFEDAWQVWSNSELWYSCITSLVIAAAVALLSTLLGFLITRHIAKKNLVWAYLPYIFSPVILATSWQYYFSYFHLTGTELGLSVALLFICTPYAVIYLMDFWNVYVSRYELLGRSLGVGSTYFRNKVLWPLARPVFVVCFFQCFLICWFDYGMAAFIGLGKVQTLTLSVFGYVGSADIHLAARASILLLIPSTMLIFSSRKSLMRKWN